MRADRLFVLLMIGLAVLVPMILLPFIGAGVVATVEQIVSQSGPNLHDGPAVRLLNGPMLGPGGRQGGAVYLELQLPSLAAAERLCRSEPVLIDGFHVYAADHPRRMDPARSGAQRDPSLSKALQAVVPWVPLDGARLLQMHQYLRQTQAADAYLCQRGILKSTSNSANR